MGAATALVMAYVCVGYTATAAANAKRLQNAEYRFSVAFPRELRVCNAMSGAQIHGFYVHLGGDCQAPSGDPAQRAISVYAYFNTIFASTPEEGISGLCRGGVPDAGVETGTLGFPGRRSAGCHARLDDGSIVVYVVAQAGRWPESEPSPLDTPYINYTAALRTTQATKDEDLAMFGAVLSSVQIGE